MICRLRTYQAVEKNLPTRHFWRIRRPSLCSCVAQKPNMPSTGKKSFPQFLRFTVCCYKEANATHQWPTYSCFAIRYTSLAFAFS